eukprot:gene12586-16877_t
MSLTNQVLWIIFISSILANIYVYLDCCGISKTKTSTDNVGDVNSDTNKHALPPKMTSIKSENQKLSSTSVNEMSKTRINPNHAYIDRISDKNIAKLTHNTNNENPKLLSISWTDFIKMPYRGIPYFDSLNERKRANNYDIKPLNQNLPVIQCKQEISDKLSKPMLSEKDMKWCKWALSPSGGNVIVGKSWGNLKTKSEKEIFDALNCNSVNTNNRNPSCDDSWGDASIYNWVNRKDYDITCQAEKSSNIDCFRNDNKDIFCTIKNLQINFNKYRRKPRPGLATDSKDFDKDFLSTDCNSKSVEGKFPFPYLYSPQLSSDTCDYVYEGTLLLYSHDDIKNLGHTMNDIMNLWIMLWLDGLARNSTSLDILNIDSFKLGHNHNDQPNSFFRTYYKNFKNVLKGSDYQGKTLCIQRALIQPIPPRFFIWESWFKDLPCSFVGPSSLYQRWNMHVRNSYELINDSEMLITNNKIVILLIVRNMLKNDWGSQRTSRNFLNTKDIEDNIQKTLTETILPTLPQGHTVELIAKDLGTLSFDEQVKLISSTSIMIGTHGAGISSSMHMAIGTKYCCGIIEIYPQGEFSPIRGHGNMARKMGISYDKFDITAQNSKSNGVQVPVDELSTRLVSMVNQIKNNPTCVLKEVFYNPYME